MESVYIRGVKFPMELVFTTRNLLLLFFHPRLFSFSARMYVGLYRMYPKCLDKYQERGLYIKTKEKSHINIVAENVWYVLLVIEGVEYRERFKRENG
jgi:hypothetical protein